MLSLSPDPRPAARRWIKALKIPTGEAVLSVQFMASRASAGLRQKLYSAPTPGPSRDIWFTALASGIVESIMKKALTVAELIEKLKAKAGDARVVVDGFDTGFDDVVAVHEVPLRLDVGPRDVGQHRIAKGRQRVDCTAIYLEPRRRAYSGFSLRRALSEEGEDEE